MFTDHNCLPDSAAAEGQGHPGDKEWQGVFQVKKNIAILQLYLRLLSIIAGVLGRNVLEQDATLVMTSHTIPVAPILTSSVHKKAER